MILQLHNRMVMLIYYKTLLLYRKHKHGYLYRCHGRLCNINSFQYTTTSLQWGAKSTTTLWQHLFSHITPTVCRVSTRLLSTYIFKQYCVWSFLRLVFHHSIAPQPLLATPSISIVS